MANRTFLIQSESQSPIRRIGEPLDALAAGSNCIPVYWCSLFDESCIVNNEVTLDDGHIEPYPYLITSAADAKERALRHQSLLDSFACEPCPDLPQKWRQFLRDIELPFIHLDPAELWMLLGDRDLRSYVQSCLRAFELQRQRGGSLIDNELFLEMFDTAQIDINNIAKSATAYKLAGYSWGNRSVPWQI